MGQKTTQKMQTQLFSFCFEQNKRSLRRNLNETTLCLMDWIISYNFFPLLFYCTLSNRSKSNIIGRMYVVLYTYIEEGLKQKARQRSIWKKLLNSSVLFQNDRGKTANAARNWTNSAPQTDATTFVLASVPILLLCCSNTVL